MEEKGNVLQEINIQPQGKLADLLVEHGYCPECTPKLAPKLEHKDADLVCTHCGLVADQLMNATHLVPFGENSEPQNSIDFGHGEGQTLGEKGLWVVLAKATGKPYKCPKCGYENNDLPLRAQQIKNICRFTHPKILTLLDLGSKRLTEWGFGDRKNKRNAMVSHYYGDILRNVGTFVALSKRRVRPSKVADACFAFCMFKLFGLQKLFEVMPKLNIEPDLYENVYEYMTEAFGLLDRLFSLFQPNRKQAQRHALPVPVPVLTS